MNRKQNKDENPIGRRSESVIGWMSRPYLVEFPDGEVTELAANTIATTMELIATPRGMCTYFWKPLLFGERRSMPIPLEEQEVTRNGRRCLRRTTAGLELWC